MKKPIKDIVAKNIRRYRKEAGLSQDKLAKSARMTSRYVSKIEATPQNLTIETMEVIAEVLGVPVAELLAESLHPRTGKRTELQKSIRQVVVLLEDYLEILEKSG